MNTTQDCSGNALKGMGRHVSCTTRVSPVKFTINEKYGLGRDESQFIVYRAVKHKSAKHKSREHKPVAYFTSLEAALLWIVMRQAHFDDEPTIDTDIVDAFQRYCHHLDRVKADIVALAERMEAALP